MHKLNVDELDVRPTAPKLSADHRSQYLFNSRVMGIDESDCILVIGGNPRTEMPVLNARLRKAVEQNGLEVFFLGSAPDVTYNYQHLGNST